MLKPLVCYAFAPLWAESVSRNGKNYPFTTRSRTDAFKQSKVNANLRKHCREWMRSMMI